MALTGDGNLTLVGSNPPLILFASSAVRSCSVLDRPLALVRVLLVLVRVVFFGMTFCSFGRPFEAPMLVDLDRHRAGGAEGGDDRRVLAGTAGDDDHDVFRARADGHLRVGWLVGEALRSDGRSEERRVGKSVDLGGSGIIKKKKGERRVEARRERRE